MSIQELFKIGGWAMWPLLLFSVITFTIVLERIIFYIKTDWRITYTKNKKRCPAAEIFNAGKTCPVENKIAAMETEAVHQLNLLEQGFSHLTIIASLSPVVGFLGTVSGMISAFATIANAADVNVKLVAGGIFEALITTAFGLIVSLIASVSLHILRHQTQHWASKMEYLGTKLESSQEYKNENNSQPLKK